MPTAASIGDGVHVGLEPRQDGGVPRPRQPARGCALVSETFVTGQLWVKHV